MNDMEFFWASVFLWRELIFDDISHQFQNLTEGDNDYSRSQIHGVNRAIMQIHIYLRFVHLLSEKEVLVCTYILCAAF